MPYMTRFNPGMMNLPGGPSIPTDTQAHFSGGSAGQGGFVSNSSGPGNQAQSTSPLAFGSPLMTAAMAKGTSMAFPGTGAAVSDYVGNALGNIQNGPVGQALGMPSTGITSEATQAGSVLHPSVTSAALAPTTGAGETIGNGATSQFIGGGYGTPAGTGITNNPLGFGGSSGTFDGTAGSTYMPAAAGDPAAEGVGLGQAYGGDAAATAAASDGAAAGTAAGAGAADGAAVAGAGAEASSAAAAGGLAGAEGGALTLGAACPWLLGAAALGYGLYSLFS